MGFLTLFPGNLQKISTNFKKIRQIYRKNLKNYIFLDSFIALWGELIHERFLVISYYVVEFYEIYGPEYDWSVSFQLLGTVSKLSLMQVVTIAE